MQKNSIFISRLPSISPFRSSGAARRTHRAGRRAGRSGRVDTGKRANLNAFPDANKVSRYAKDALAWANAEGLINGTKEGKQIFLDPTGSATRAQVATILARYAQNIVV